MSKFISTKSIVLFILTCIMGGQSNLSAQCYVFWGDTLGNYRCEKPDVGVSSFGEYERILIGNQRIERRFFKNTKVVAEEYISIEKDTFLYISYDTLTHEYFERGNVVLSKIYGVDTIIMFDPNSFEEIRTYQYYYQPSRIGEWHLSTKSKFHVGQYLNDIRIGKWLEYNRETEEGFHLYFDSLGNYLSVDPENIIKSKNLDKIKERFKGEWIYSYSDMAFWRIESVKSFDDCIGCIRITSDSIIYNDSKSIGCYGRQLFRKAASWEILTDGELVLSHKLFELDFEKKKRYRIKTLKDNYMEVIRIE